VQLFVGARSIRESPDERELPTPTGHISKLQIERHAFLTMNIEFPRNFATEIYCLAENLFSSPRLRYCFGRASLAGSAEPHAEYHWHQIGEGLQQGTTKQEELISSKDWNEERSEVRSPE